jgi:hypothetical protein
MKALSLTIAAGLISGVLAFAQSPCPEDSLALIVSVSTDAWGYEAYWELLPLEAECGDGDALVWGGNSEVGCGNGVSGLPSDPMPSNTMITFPTVCVSDGDSLVLFHRDSYGDGGSNFALAIGGYEVAGYAGTGGGNAWGFVAHEPSYYAGDLPCLAEPIEANADHYVGNTTTSTVSPGEPAPPSWGCGSFGGWCESGLSNTKWLEWQVPEEGGVYWISTCNDSTSFDTQVAMWSATDCADWSTFELVNANDDIECSSGAFRSGFLTPCLEGGEVFLLQIDGYYGDQGSVEVSIDSAPAEDMWFGGAVTNVSCNLEQGFNPNGAIGLNVSSGPGSANFSWTGPFGFSSTGDNIGPLLPGVYEVVAEFCGAESTATFEVQEPEAMSMDLTLTADCEAGAMMGAAQIAGGTGEMNVQWEVAGEIFSGVNVNALPEGFCEVVAIDQQGCELTDFVWVDAVGVPTVDLGSDVLACVGDALTLLAPFGNGLSYAWSTGQTGPLAVVTPSASGTLVVGVEVTDEAGCSDSDAIIITVQECTSGLAQLDLPGRMDEVTISPNPFHHQVQVDFGRPISPSTVTLLDACGRHVDVAWQPWERGLSWEGSLEPGVYLLTSTSLPGVIRLVAQ